MATAIVWDDDPTVEPEPPTPKQALLNPDPRLSEAHRALFLGTVDTGELVAELAKRGYDAHPRITYYMPATVSTPITVPTVTTSAGTFTVPATTSTYTYSSLGQTLAPYGSAQYYSQLMQNAPTLGSSSAITSSAPEPKVSTWKALLGRDK